MRTCWLFFFVALAACKGGSEGPAAPAPVAAAGAAALVDSPQPTGRFEHLGEISVIADPDTGRVLIAAPAGSVAGVAGAQAKVTIWEAKPAPLGPQFVSAPNRLELPADPRDAVAPAADGSFTAEVVAARRGILVLSTQTPAAGATALAVGAPSPVTAAFVDPFAAAEVAPLTADAYVAEGDSAEVGP